MNIANQQAMAPFFQCLRPMLSPEILDRTATLSLSHRFLYFRIFKAANSTVVSNLFAAETGKVVQDLLSLQNIKDTHYDRLSSVDMKTVRMIAGRFFKFTVVRDPYTRVLSAYLDKIRCNENGKAIAVAQHLRLPLHKAPTFSDFIDYLERGGLRKNAHWCRQVDLIPYPIKMLDHIAKMESLEMELPAILNAIFCSRINMITAVRSHATDSRREHPLLNVAVRKRIYDLYRADFRQFGYDP